MATFLPSKQYRTSDGDMVDLICFNYYGQTEGTVEMVLDNNPGLGERGPILPGGLLIFLPAYAPGPKKKTVVNLWD